MYIHTYKRHKKLNSTFYTCKQGVKLTVAWLPFATNKCTGMTNFQNFSGFRRHYWRLSCSSVYNYGRCGHCILVDMFQCKLLSTKLRKSAVLCTFTVKSSQQCTSDLLNILPRAYCIYMAYNMLLSTFSGYCKVYA